MAAGINSWVVVKLIARCGIADSWLLRNEDERDARLVNDPDTSARQGFHNYIPISKTSIEAQVIGRPIQVIKIAERRIDKSRVHLRNSPAGWSNIAQWSYLIAEVIFKNEIPFARIVRAISAACIHRDTN